eukprot:CAMPEP_0197834718 /NCGR_PEP_ID=MMETSP1437-20131217/23436_1 /TAXON_ID=49252 ORGANISM="Eucampia antarctica, Strain CCMP1452" /NCGR_SAMPLE_ID=MMETSP1437 /ASSEMBLY_ACC=CAM_ASM_001096 /LENGTH=218 /DNA_ID=CAMNT_0043439625 /DNA_START=75 /DNA_END=732 /DNA_ORIENTATION=+
MPASAKGRMPHNNRLSTSAALRTSDIWSKTIGYDPYAAENEKGAGSDAVANADKARSLLELARHQNVGGRAAGNDEFARKMFLGLKGGKKRRSDDPNNGPESVLSEELRKRLEEDSSSSEEEFVTMKGEEGIGNSEQGGTKKKSQRDEKKHRKKRKYKKRKKYASSSSDDDDDSGSKVDSSDSSHRRQNIAERKNTEANEARGIEVEATNSEKEKVDE